MSDVIVSPKTTIANTHWRDRIRICIYHPSLLLTIYVSSRRWERHIIDSRDSLTTIAHTPSFCEKIKCYAHRLNPPSSWSFVLICIQMWSTICTEKCPAKTNVSILLWNNDSRPWWVKAEYIYLTLLVDITVQINTSGSDCYRKPSKSGTWPHQEPV